ALGRFQEFRQRHRPARRRRVQHPGRPRRARGRFGDRPDARRVGARHRSTRADRRRRADHRRQPAHDPGGAAGPHRACPGRSGGEIRSQRPRQHRGCLAPGSAGPDRQTVSGPEARDLLGHDAIALRRRAGRDGAVLLPARPDGLHRPVVLQRDAASLPRRRRLRLCLCGRPRGGAPCRERARHPPPRPAASAGGRAGPGQPALGAGRAHGRLPGRRLGVPLEPEMEVDRGGRRRRGDARRRRDRRRPPAAPVSGPGLAGILHPRLFGAAHALVHAGAEDRSGAGLRHVPREPDL
ncbi:MAG: YpfJ protein, zinc metalloprotease superfamily, partial [uncultured Microvirga sp.]